MDNEGNENRNIQRLSDMRGTRKPTSPRKVWDNDERHVDPQVGAKRRLIFQEETEDSP